MMTEFKDKVALITGAANGFGKVFAMEAVKRGMKVAIVDIDGDDLFGVTALLKKMGGEVLPIEADVTDYSQVKMSVDKTMETFGQIDILFANAGIAPSGDIFNLPARDWQWAAYANLISHGWYYSLVLPIMAKQGTACHIIATASIAGILHGIGNNPAYSATKHAAVALAEDVRAYCKTNNYNIGVSVYCPAYVQTDLHHTERHRPERFAQPDDPYYKSQHYIDAVRRVNVNITTGTPLEPVGRRLFKAIEEGHFYILTHYQYAPYIASRHRGIEADGKHPNGLGIETDRDFKGQVALITGAASGFGLEFAKEAAERGMKLALVDIQKEKLEGVAAEFAEKGVECLALPADTSLYDDVCMTVKATMDKYGQIDVLFNNAGVAVVGDVEHIRPKDWEWAVSVNLLGQAYYLREVLPIMVKQGTPANILSTASIAGVIPGFAKVPSYSATKHGVVALTESVCARLQAMGVTNIKVGVFCPGFIQTQLHHSDDYRPERFKQGDDPYYQSEYYAARRKGLDMCILTGTELDPVAKRLFLALEEGQKYILTHEKHYVQFEARHAAIEKENANEANVVV